MLISCIVHYVCVFLNPAVYVGVCVTQVRSHELVVCCGIAALVAK